jgi:hypothetical protein
MKENVLLKRIELLEYHQTLLLLLMTDTNKDFYKLVITKKVSQHQVEAFFEMCEKLSLEIEVQKAEGFVYFHPLFKEFQVSLPQNIDPEEMITACLVQKLYLPLMTEFKKYL